MEGLDFGAVSDVSPGIVSSTEGVRPDSRGFLFPDSDQLGLVCPHLVGESAPAMKASDSRKAVGVKQVEVGMHKLDTSIEISNEKHLACNNDGACISPSPSPLSEPVFEPYVICTKTRSETSCSNNSQFSSSSGERLEGWCQGTPDEPPIPSGSGSEDCDFGMERLRCTSPAHDVGRDGQGKEPVRMLISASHETPQVLCETKPVLPPAENFLEERPPSSPLFFPSIDPASSTDSSQPSSLQSPSSKLHDSLHNQRTRALTFTHYKVGEEGGKFNVDYLGMKDVDMYIKSINSVAKELAMSQKPKEIQVFVTSERIRLAPPNSPTLFRSFPVKDILLLRKCSKNRRILGVIVWKRKLGVPSCHIMRCQDDLVASALYNAIWQQTQKVDEITYSKVREGRRRREIICMVGVDEGLSRC